MTDEQLLAALKVIRRSMRLSGVPDDPELICQIAGAVKQWLSGEDEPVQTFEPSPSSE